jgi:Fic family protein
VIPYLRPRNWISYDVQAVTNALVEAKSVVLSLKTIPYQRSWVEALQKMQLKREVAGTSRIEGAEFTDRELEAALKETTEQLLTRSQRQAHAAMQAYRWIATIPDARSITAELICEIHRRIVTGADDDHCPAGKIRERDHNVTFGSPRHRGVEGGDECKSAFTELAHVIERQLKDHDPIIQALAAHYHFAAMHPFLDGNGRTARALEALLLQRAGLRETCFIAMSNYYYDEKTSYLAALAKVREDDNDLTQFLVFGLKGIAIQARRLLQEIQHQISRELFRNLMFRLFHRLKTPRRRIIAERQIDILKLLLDVESMELEELISRTAPSYKGLKDARTAVIRDLNALIGLGAVGVTKTGDQFHLAARLEWPTEITETQFFAQLKKLPKAKTPSFVP